MRKGRGRREGTRESQRETDLAIVTPAEHILAGGQMGWHFDDIHDSDDLHRRISLSSNDCEVRAIYIR